MILFKHILNKPKINVNTKNINATITKDKINTKILELIKSIYPSSLFSSTFISNTIVLSCIKKNSNNKGKNLNWDSSLIKSSKH